MKKTKLFLNKLGNLKWKKLEIHLVDSSAGENLVFKQQQMSYFKIQISINFFKSPHNLSYTYS